MTAVGPATAVAQREPQGGSRESVHEARLGLLGGFDLTVDGESVSLPMNGQRVLAFLALQRHPVQRTYVAGSLWLDSTDDRAAGSLRSALWRINRRQRLVEANGEGLRLAAHVRVDVDAAVDQAHRLLDPAGSERPGRRELRLFDDVLPDWYDDWVTIERERFRQLRMHALERFCDRLSAAARFGEAIEAGLAVVEIEPLRESAHRTLIRAHLAEGNRNEAMRQYRRFRALLLDQLGLHPSEQMEALVAGFTSQ